MADTPITCVLDTSVFTQAHRLYYPVDICPGFWDCLLHYARAGRLISIDRMLRGLGSRFGWTPPL